MTSMEEMLKFLDCVIRKLTAKASHEKTLKEKVAVQVELRKTEYARIELLRRY